MKLLCDSFVQVRIGATENNSHRATELFQLKSCSRAGAYRGQQILIQAEECWTGARGRIELLIQQRHELISNLSVSEESADLPPIDSPENEVIKNS